MISIAYGTCLSYNVKIESNQYPKLHYGFKKAIAKLYKAAEWRTIWQKDAFKEFIEKFGTHFLLETNMGTLFTHETWYSSHPRKIIDAETLKKCHAINSALFFNKEVGDNGGQCDKENDEKLQDMPPCDVSSTTASKGSHLINIRKWKNESFTPVPIQYALSPIVNLFKDSVFKEINFTEFNCARPIDSKTIRKWFIPMYRKYLKDMKGSNNPEGCGIDDECPTDTLCKDNQDNGKKSNDQPKSGASGQSGIGQAGTGGKDFGGMDRDGTKSGATGSGERGSVGQRICGGRSGTTRVNNVANKTRHYCKGEF